MFVSDQERLRLDMLGDGRPCILAVLVHPASPFCSVHGGWPPSAPELTCACRSDFPSCARPCALPSCHLAEDAAHILAVDLRRTVQLDRITAKVGCLPELLQQEVGGLILDVGLAAQMERRHALGGRDLLPDCHDDLLE